MFRPVYLDYNATTPLDSKVREAMLTGLGEAWGNPSSVHAEGRKARALLDDARERAALCLGAKPSEIVFTGGGTESNNLAVLGIARHLRSRGKHLITSSVEHHAVLHCFDHLEREEGFEVTRLPVDSAGRVSVDDLGRALRKDTVLVSVMAANNEVGTIQPVQEIGALCRSRGVLFHVDAVQWFGKASFQDISRFNADLVSLCGHKFHGPKGAGLLYIRSPIHLDPLFFGGSHELDRRAGTENLAAILGLAYALENFLSPPVFDPGKLLPLASRLRSCLEGIPGCSMVSPDSGCLANTVAFTVRGVDGITLVAGLDLAGICASSGSACSAGSLLPSHVLVAMGRESDAKSLVRLSLGREISDEDIDHVCSVLPEVVRCAQAGR